MKYEPEPGGGEVSAFISCNMYVYRTGISKENAISLWLVVAAWIFFVLFLLLLLHSTLFHKGLQN